MRGWEPGALVDEYGNTRQVANSSRAALMARGGVRPHYRRCHRLSCLSIATLGDRSTDDASKSAYDYHSCMTGN